MKKKLFMILGGLFLFTLLVAPTAVLATSVGTELLLLADVSGSVDSNDFALQRAGYEAAFRDGDVIDAIVDAGGIAVSLVYWSTSQAQVVNWYHIYDATTANAFADLVAGTSRTVYAGGTYMADAMEYGATLFTDNGFEGDYYVVDVSGDGSDSEVDYQDQYSTNVQNARDTLVTAGIDMINALWIEDDPYFGDDASDYVDAVLYGQANVIYGDGSFSWLVDGFDEFAAGVKAKIIAEVDPGDYVAPVPEPATMLLLGTGLVAAAGIRRKKKK